MAAHVRGLGQALARMRRIPAAAREAREVVLEDWARETKDDATDRAPEHTGRLKGSIDKRVYDDAAYVGIWDPDSLEYAEYVERGTSSMDEQPYLRPAFEANRAEVAARFRAEIQRRLPGGGR